MTIVVAVPDECPRTSGTLIAVWNVGLVSSTTLPLPVVPSERSLAANCATVNAPPAVVCLTTCDVPPVAEKSVVPPGRVTVVVPATAAGFTVVVPLVLPFSTTELTVGLAEYDGAAPTPPEVSTCPVATSASAPTVFVPEAYRMSPVVAAFGSTNVDHAGAVLTPPDRRNDPAATSASLLSVVAPEA